MFEGLRKYVLRLDLIILVLLATILGALLRWQLHNDFLSNILGTALFGLVLGLNLSPRVQLIFTIGFSSAFTTFSGWIWNVTELMRSGYFFRAFGLLFSTLMGGFLVLSVGLWTGKKMRHLFHPQ